MIITTKIYVNVTNHKVVQQNTILFMNTLTMPLDIVTTLITLCSVGLSVTICPSFTALKILAILKLQLLNREYFKHSSCPFVNIKLENFQGPYEGYTGRTELNQTGTFVYKQVQFTFNNLTPSTTTDH